MFLLSMAASGFTASPDEAGKGKAVDFRVYDRYFAKGDSEQAGQASYLVITSQERFDAMFGTPMFGFGDKKVDGSGILPRDAFASRMVVAAIKRGGEWWDYKVQGVTASGDRLTVRYTAVRHDGSGAQFASPMVVSVPKGDYRSVVFIENGKEAGTAQSDEQQSKEAPR